jgi:DNA-binding transcriptional LysR family regulator
VNLKHLETFHHFGKFLSVSQTAEHLHISQPAVSQQLRAFEAECGVKLFYRANGAYKFTELGQTMFLLSKRVFSRVDQLEEMLDKARKSTSEHLRIGTTKAYACTLMPDLLAQFREKFPRVRLRLSEGNTSELISRLKQRKEDLVLVARTAHDASIKAIPFARAKFVLVARPDHALALNTPVAIESLHGEPLIIREHGSGSREAILKKLSQYGVTPSVVMESDSLSFILACIHRKVGLSFVLSHEIENELAAGTLSRIELAEGDITFQADILTLRNELLSVPMRYFLKIAKQRRDSSQP